MQYGREAYVLMQKGVIDCLSIGFQLQKSFICSSNGRRLLQQIDLQEISLVTFAANPMAKIIHLKEMRNYGVMPQVQKLSRLIQSI